LIRAGKIESRIFLIGGVLVAIGGLFTALVFGPRYGASFIAGGLLSAANLALLRRTVNLALLRAPHRSSWRIICGYILRLLLIPLCLYAMMRLLFLGIIAAIAGFAVFSCSVFIEGVSEAFKKQRE
jgi:hypothetical protein